MGTAHARIHAGGGLLIRDGRHGEVEVALVHRPRYDDWSLPKGKLDPGETFEEAAIREVREETGFVCELGEELESVTYEDRKGRPKLVRYWLMRPLDGRFVPGDEVDELRWCEAEQAIELTDYEHDRRLIRSLDDS